MTAKKLIISILLMSLFLISQASIMHGYLTGSTFLFAHVFSDSKLYDVIVLTVFFYSVWGTLALLFKITPGGLGVFGWSASIILSLLITVLVLFLVGEKADIGKYFRVYVSVSAFYVGLILSSLGLLVSRKYRRSSNHNKDSVWLVAVLPLAVGIAIYFLKPDSFASANHNFIMQLVLCELCVVAPVCVVFAAIANKYT